MTRIATIRLIVIIAAIAALELACRTGLIDHRIVVPPSEMAATLIRILASGTITGDIARTLGMIAIAALVSIVFGFALGLLVHATPRATQGLHPQLATSYCVAICIFSP